MNQTQVLRWSVKMIKKKQVLRGQLKPKNKSSMFRSLSFSCKEKHDIHPKNLQHTQGLYNFKFSFSENIPSKNEGLDILQNILQNAI